MEETKTSKEILVEALTDKTNKNHKNIISSIVKYMPKNKVYDCFVFVCQGAAKTPLSQDIATFTLNQLLGEDDIETVTDKGYIENLKTIGDLIVAIDVQYVNRKYPSIIEDISKLLFEYLTNNFSSSPQFCELVAKMLDIYDDNTLDKICDDCKNYFNIEVDDNETSEKEQSEENTTNK